MAGFLAVKLDSMKRRAMMWGGADKNTLLLLHFDGNFIDATGNFKLNNTGAVINKSNVKFGTGSAYFKNGLLVFPNKQWLTDLLDSGNYTIDFWMKKYFQATSSWYTEIPFSDDYARDTYGFTIKMQVAYNTNFFEFGNYEQWNVTGFLNHYNNNNNVWNHIAITCKNGHTRIFINGQKIAEKSSYYPTLRNHKLCIGGRDGNDSNCDGYYDEFRISNVARWTSNFTPPTEPYKI